ncbi:hypothetical protein [Streptomyces caeruleatus]|uniref:RraA family protein n=1 Tax=Streptomyces caeruleatus TaxID=661399 RepID=UPI000B213FB1|nr:hypothetical protein [Streptomyces caeruleatus]
MHRTSPIATADLADEHGDQLWVCDVQFISYGAVHSFAGPVRALSCPGDNALLHELLRTPGEGCVAVVDGGASLRTALLGDLMAERARDNGWAGVVVYGAVATAPSSPAWTSASTPWAPALARAGKRARAPSTCARRSAGASSPPVTPARRPRRSRPAAGRLTLAPTGISGPRRASRPGSCRGARRGVRRGARQAGNTWS